MTTQVDPRFLHQDPEATAWLRQFSNLPWNMQYIVAVESPYCLTFDAKIVDDERPLFRWIMDHGGLPVVDPKQNYWYKKGVVWFPNSRSRWYAILTASEYLTRDWWWKLTFDFNDDYQAG